MRTKSKLPHNEKEGGCFFCSATKRCVDGTARSAPSGLLSGAGLNLAARPAGDRDFSRRLPLPSSVGRTQLSQRRPPLMVDGAQAGSRTDPCTRGQGEGEERGYGSGAPKTRRQTDRRRAARETEGHRETETDRRLQEWTIGSYRAERRDRGTERKRGGAWERPGRGPVGPNLPPPAGFPPCPRGTALRFGSSSSTRQGPKQDATCLAET